MNLGKSLYPIVTVFVACSLIAAGLSIVSVSGIGEGWRGAQYVQRLGPALAVCCICATVGVIWLGWRWSRLDGEITLTVQTLEKADTTADTSAGETHVAEGLAAAISHCLSRYKAQVAGLQKQVGELQLQNQLAQKRETHVEAIIYSIRDAVIVVDEYDRLLMANEVAGRLFNFDFKCSQHKAVDEVITSPSDDDDAAAFADFLKQGRQSTGRATRKELQFLDDGRPKTFDCIVSRIRDQEGGVCGAVAVLHDITREKEISQMKNDFVSHVSHELKTPLASITAYSEMLCDGEADDEQTRKKFYAVIQSQAKRLNRLIEDILNTSRIESGLIKVSKEPVSLTILIEEQLQMIRSYAEEKGIAVRGQTPIVFDQVYVDRDMISQVIVNLLSNAVKYTPAGGEVGIEMEVDEVAGLARVRVSDTGVGIPEDETGHVFDKFYRVGANTKQAKGTGLGLNLVKQIVEKVHSGRVFVTSKVGEGSTFGFELPLAATAETVKAV